MKSMNRIFATAGLLLGLGLSSPAALSSGTLNASITDGNLSGYASTINVTSGDVGGSYLTALTLTLNISGGYNGDLYAYVSHNGVLVPLINRVGVSSADALGYDNAGFTITLSASGANNVHLYQDYSPTYSGGQLTGTWQPDGRAISPLSASGSFDAAPSVGFSAYNGMDPVGNWTLYVADVVGGSYGSSTLNSWSMDITAVPEPMNVAAGLFAAVFAGFHLFRFTRSKRRGVPNASAPSAGVKA